MIQRGKGKLATNEYKVAEVIRRIFFLTTPGQLIHNTSAVLDSVLVEVSGVRQPTQVPLNQRRTYAVSH